MQRFLVSPATLAAGAPAIEGDIARQVAVVLRLRAGEEVTLFDGQGAESRCRLTEVSPRRVICQPLERHANRAEAALQVRLFPAVLRGPRFELVLQKATELGVCAITPVQCRRSVARFSGAAVPERWRSVVREAAEQCGRGCLPSLAVPVAFATACSQASEAELALCCSEYGGADLRAFFTPPIPRTLAVLIGPEGGLEPREVALATAHGLHAVSLGPRILRAETAALAVCAAAYCLAGEWGLADGEMRMTRPHPTLPVPERACEASCGGRFVGAGPEPLPKGDARSLSRKGEGREGSR